MTSLYGKTIGLDTAPLIYFIEENPTYLKQVTAFFEAVDRGDITVVTSPVTLLEVLVHPLRNKNYRLASEYREILVNSRLITLDTTSSIAEKAAQLRARYHIRTPDAIQLSTAMTAGAKVFLTNDVRLPRLKAMRIIALESLAD